MRYLVLVFGIAALLGCGGDSSTPPTDSGPPDTTGCEGGPFTPNSIIVRQQDEPDALFLRISNNNASYTAPDKIHDGLEGSPLETPLLMDFDGDGSIDVVASGGGFLHLLEFDGCNETWTERRLGQFSGRIVGAADFDQDGDPDLYGFDEDGTDSFVVLNEGDGDFFIEGGPFNLTIIESDQGVFGPQHPMDVTDDGIPDLVVSVPQDNDNTTSIIYRLRGDGDGTFDSPSLIQTLGAAGNGIDLGDVDGDGDADIVAGLDDDDDPGQVYLFRNNGDGFDPPEGAFDVYPAEEEGPGRGFGRLTLFDWTGDDRADALVTTRDTDDPEDTDTETRLFEATIAGYNVDPSILQPRNVGVDLHIGTPIGPFTPASDD